MYRRTRAIKQTYTLSPRTKNVPSGRSTGAPCVEMTRSRASAKIMFVAWSMAFIVPLTWKKWHLVVLVSHDTQHTCTHKQAISTKCTSITAAYKQKLSIICYNLHMFYAKQKISSMKRKKKDKYWQCMKRKWKDRVDCAYSQIQPSFVRRLQRLTLVGVWREALTR